jgi:hypothetical protein
MAVERANPSCGRSAPAGFDHGLDCISHAGKYRFDRAVTAIAHPAAQAAALRLMLDERAIADTLHLPAYDDSADRIVAHRMVAHGGQRHSIATPFTFVRFLQVSNGCLI